jgi:hypothetical protein
VSPEDLLQEEISIELEAMNQIVHELISLNHDLGKREPTVREKTAAAAFLAQFYNGIENILKRISRYYDIPLPEGDAWHVVLFQQFCSPAFAPLPMLFDEGLATTLAPYRRFRHVVFHSYGFQIDWEKMARGTEDIQHVSDDFQASITQFMNSI